MVILKNYNLYLLTITLLSCANIFAIKINGEELSDIIKPDQPLASYVSDDRDFVNIYMKDGNLEIQSNTLNNAKKIHSDFINLQNRKNRFTKFTIDKNYSELDTSSSGDLIRKDYFAKAYNKILLDAALELNISNSILTSHKIIFGCKKINLENCYVDTDVLRIEVDSFESLCQVIEFKFKKNAKLPYLINGQIDFENNLTINDLQVFGIKEIRIWFSPKAFELTK